MIIVKVYFGIIDDDIVNIIVVSVSYFGGGCEAVASVVPRDYYDTIVGVDVSLVDIGLGCFGLGKEKNYIVHVSTTTPTHTHTHREIKK